MLSKVLPPPIIGWITFLLYTINTFFWVGPIFVIALIKLLLPLKLVTAFCNYLLNFFASSWISVNGWVNYLTMTVRWEVDLPESLSTKQWYLVVANHQSWVDILALQQTLNGRIPFLKFFLKQELFWVPVLGIAWWALDFPFMKRYSKSYIKKNPHKKGEDFKTTQKACEKFKSVPISIMNFAEGTRFSAEKRAKQSSPFQYLLKPKSGGIGYVLTLMGNEIDQVLDITIQYPDNSELKFWDYVSGKVTRIQLKGRLIKVPAEIKGDYINNSENRRLTQQWVNRLWSEKDQEMLSGQALKSAK